MRSYSAMVIFVVVAMLSSRAWAAKLSIEVGAFQKLVSSKLVDGRLPLGKQDKCNNTYLENPQVQLRDGRVFLRAHFAGRIGTEVAGICVGLGDPSWFAISGVPAKFGDALELTDVRIEELEKTHWRPLADQAIGSLSKTVLAVNLRSLAEESLRSQGLKPFEGSLRMFSLRQIFVSGDRVSVEFDFELGIR